MNYAKLEKLVDKLYFLKRKETEYYTKASVEEAIDVLSECCNFILMEMEFSKPQSVEEN